MLTELDQNTTNIAAAFNDSSLGYVNAVATDTGTANNYIVSLPFGSPTAYNQGMTIAFVAANNNISGGIGNSTITVSPLGSTQILDASGNQLIINTIQAGAKYEAVFIGTAFRLIGPSGGRSQFYVLSNTTQTFTVNCSGYSVVNVYTQVATGGNTLTVQFNNLGASVPIYWIFANTSAGSASLNVLVYLDSGVTILPGTIQFMNLNTNALVNFPVSLAAGKTAILNGMLFYQPTGVGPESIIFSYSHN